MTNPQTDDAASLTLHVAEFVSGTTLDDVPAGVVELGRKSILDGLGLALAGSVAESGRLVERYLAPLASPDGPCRALGTSLRLPARFAAFANGVAIHADDYDDTQIARAKDRVNGLLTHPTAPVLPAALAVGEADDQSGAQVMFGYQVGVEVACKIAEAIEPRHYRDGFHSTATCGVFGAAAAVAAQHRCDTGTVRTILGIAGSQAGGLRENFGTMMKPFHAGRAAESGVLAAEMAAIGWTATPVILEAGRGFFKAAGGGWSDAAIRGALGNPWTFADPGVSIKPHPSGSFSHPGMTLMAELIEAHDIRPEQVKRVRVGTNSHMPNALIHHRPKTELQAKFSMEFCMAILLLERRAGLAEFTDATVNRADVQQMIGRVDFGVHPEAEAAGYDKMTTIVEIELSDGRTIEDRADSGRGSPSKPMGFEEVADKFRECADYAGWPADRAQEAVAMVAELEKLPSIRTLTALLSR
ncbi:MAG: MmgE/PrpD family protein [Acetobacterales bacterium]